jgi:hypothetical protein
MGLPVAVVIFLPNKKFNIAYEAYENLFLFPILWEGVQKFSCHILASLMSIAFLEGAVICN